METVDKCGEALAASERASNALYISQVCVSMGWGPEASASFAEAMAGYPSAVIHSPEFWVLARGIVRVMAGEPPLGDFVAGFRPSTASLGCVAQDMMDHWAFANVEIAMARRGNAPSSGAVQ